MRTGLTVGFEAIYHTAILFVVTVNGRVVDIDNELVGALAVGALTSPLWISTIANLKLEVM